MSERQHGVFALRYARRSDSTRADHFYGHDPDGDAPYPIDYFIWVISRPEGVTVIDAGYTREVSAMRVGDRQYFGDPDVLLGLLGISVDEVDTLVLTHLHYDHTGHLRAFPNARVWVQQREVEFWHLPLVKTRGDYPSLHGTADIDALDDLISAQRVNIIDGDVEIDDITSLHMVGGHSPGMTVVRVRQPGVTVVLASDASHFYENFEQDKPFAIVHELPAMYLAFDRLRELAGADGVIVPGHDPRVADRHAVVGDGRVIRLDGAR